MESRVRATSDQVSTLLEFMETHGDLARLLPGPQGRLRSDRLWTKLTKILNAVGGGVSKSTDKWKKVWADWKSKTKKKALTIRHHARGARGGPAKGQTLSASEKRLLALMGSAAVKKEKKELGFNGPLNTPQDDSAANDDSDTQDDSVYLENLDETPHLTWSPEQSPTNPAALPTPRRWQPPAPSTSAISPSTRRHLQLRSPATPQSAARRRQAPTPFEKAASEFTAVELRRLELEETRTRLQHERDMRSLEVEHERNQILSSLVNVAQAWLDYSRSRDNTNS